MTTEPVYDDAPPPGADTQRQDRLPPHNIEAEKALLGTLLVKNDVHERVGDVLRPEHFAYGPHGDIYRACMDLIEKGRKADPITLKRHFERDRALSEIGGPEYLLELAQSAVGVISAGEYGNLIYDLYRKREVIGLADALSERAFAGGVDDSATALIEDAEAALFELSGSGGARSRDRTEYIESAFAYIKDRYQNPGAIAGAPTGIAKLDRMMMGLQPGQLIVAAGRPGMGKSTFAQHIAKSAAKAYLDDGRDYRDGGRGCPVLLLSLEMSAEEYVLRLVSDVSGVPFEFIRSGKYGHKDQPRKVSEAKQSLLDLPLYIDERPAPTVPMIRATTRRHIKKNGVGLVIIDQLPQVRANDQRAGPVQQISQITRDMKAVAVELGVPILMLHQLNRGVESREDKRPVLSDLRDSGSIEQDADAVIFLYRESYYLERAEPARRESESEEAFQGRMERWQERLEATKNTVEIILPKQRMGPVGAVKALCDLNYLRMGDLTYG